MAAVGKIRKSDMYLSTIKSEDFLSTYIEKLDSNHALAHFDSGIRKKAIYLATKTSYPEIQAIELSELAEGLVQLAGEVGNVETLVKEAKQNILRTIKNPIKNLIDGTHYTLRGTGEIREKMPTKNPKKKGREFKRFGDQSTQFVVTGTAKVLIFQQHLHQILVHSFEMSDALLAYITAHHELAKELRRAVDAARAVQSEAQKARINLATEARAFDVVCADIGVEGLSVRKVLAKRNLKALVPAIQGENFSMEYRIRRQNGGQKYGTCEASLNPTPAGLSNFLKAAENSSKKQGR